MKAFPLLSRWDDHELNGMDLRDYFAAAAMQGLMAEPCWAGIENEDIAEECYKMADEMMKAREQ
jgi:hypothetical protein